MLAYETPTIELLGEGELQGVQGETWSPYVVLFLAVSPYWARTVAVVALVVWAWAWKK